MTRAVQPPTPGGSLSLESTSLAQWGCNFLASEKGLDRAAKASDFALGILEAFGLPLPSNSGLLREQSKFVQNLTKIFSLPNTIYKAYNEFRENSNSLDAAKAALNEKPKNEEFQKKVNEKCQELWKKTIKAFSDFMNKIKAISPLVQFMGGKGLDAKVEKRIGTVADIALFTASSISLWDAAMLRGEYLKKKREILKQLPAEDAEESAPRKPLNIELDNGTRLSNEDMWKNLWEIVLNVSLVAMSALSLIKNFTRFQVPKVCFHLLLGVVVLSGVEFDYWSSLKKKIAQSPSAPAVPTMAFSPNPR